MKNFKVKKSAVQGSHHWLHQRYTAIAQVVLVSWFIVILFTASANGGLLVALKNPLNAFVMILNFISVFYHGALGIQVVVEDYVHNIFYRNAIIIFTKLASFAAAAAGILAVAKIVIGN
jgi:succinate dehydrogenase / fumarate reductase membrane anchor subunit